MSKIFLSYSRHNTDTVKTLVDDLNAVGNSVWYDQTLTGGQRWWDNILSNIRECDVFIFVISTDSLESEACNSELAYSVQLNKNILPIVIDDGVNINLLPHPLNEFQVTDCRKLDKQSIFELLKAIKSMPAKSSLPNPLPAPPPVPVSYLISLKERIETKDTLDFDAQISLVFDLRNRLKEDRSPEEVADLLIRLKQRNDLFAKVNSEIDTILTDFKDIKSHNVPVTSTETKNCTHIEKTNEYKNITGNKRDKSVKPTANKTCVKCTKQNYSNAVYCSHCGSPFNTNSESNTSLEKTTQPQPIKKRSFSCAPRKYQQLVNDVEDWLRSIDFECQRLLTENEGILIQISKKGSWRKFVGMSTALNIVFKQSNNNLHVEIGAGKWVDKAIVGTVSLFVLWPLAITAGVGAWQQTKMPEKILDFVGNQLI